MRCRRQRCRRTNPDHLQHHGQNDDALVPLPPGSERDLVRRETAEYGQRDQIDDQRDVKLQRLDPDVDALEQARVEGEGPEQWQHRQCQQHREPGVTGRIVRQPGQRPGPGPGHGHGQGRRSPRVAPGGPVRGPQGLEQQIPRRPEQKGGQQAGQQRQMRDTLAARRPDLPGAQQQIKGKVVYPARQQQPAVLEQLRDCAKAVKPALPRGPVGQHDGRVAA